MKRKISIVLILLYTLNFIYPVSKSLYLCQSKIYIINQKIIKIDIYNNGTSDYNNQTIVKILKKNKFGLWKEKGVFESIKLEEGDFGEGFQDCWVEDNKIYIQQSFGDGKFLIISKLIFEYNNKDEIKLIEYIENHIDRFSEDKDFTDIHFEIPYNISINDIDSKFVYDMHKQQ